MTHRSYFACFVLCMLVGFPSPSVGQDTVAAGRSATELQKLETILRVMRDRNANDYAVRAADGVDEGRYATLGGIEQWITIRGEDRNNPVVLFLHGGPGDATNPWSYAIFRPWLKHFTVVQWDQRGAGRTLGRNGPSLAASITLERLVADGIELCEWLRTRLEKNRIILVGHSWGSILGVLMAKARPDLFHAYVGTGQVADPSRSYAVAHAALLAKARSSGTDRAVAELREIGPPPYPDGRGFAVQRKWSNFFEGADVFLAATLGLALGAPGYAPGDVNDWIDGQGVSAERLVPETSALDPNQLAGEFGVPIFVFQGAEDFTTPTELARAYVASIRAPAKAFVTLDGGHFVVFMQSRQFLAELVARVRPLALQEGR